MSDKAREVEIPPVEFDWNDAEYLAIQNVEAMCDGVSGTVFYCPPSDGTWEIVKVECD